MRFRPECTAIIALLLAASPVFAEREIQFNRDVRPIISDKCFTCHGPDANTREADLRLDEKDGLFGTSEMGQPIVMPGNPVESELYWRITEAEDDEVMPPKDAVLQLTAEEEETLRLWIEQGAEWQGHWAFIRPEKPDLPTVEHKDWVKNEIDLFILEQIEKAGMEPSPEAPRETLIRRVSLDLTGLPPTPKEIDTFLNDTDPGAYERLVDRLLASPHYGERMAVPWLDAARYSDTNGYQRDTKRFMWHWRDWVIKAFNDNMPFDQFTIEQLAGDLLPNATLSQKVATGFNRNHRINGEGGIIPEEYAVEYVADRVQTTSTTWMGLTMECARCHDHKYDPFTQKEFYQMFAFFNNVPEEGKGRERGNDTPFLPVPTDAQQAEIDALKVEIATLRMQHEAPDEDLDREQRKWERGLRAMFETQTWSPISDAEVSGTGDVTFETLKDGSFLATGENPKQTSYTVSFTADGPVAALQLEALLDDRLPQKGPGRGGNGNAVVSEISIARVPKGSDTSEPLDVSSVFADYSQEKGDYSIANVVGGDPKQGWAIGAHVRRENRVAVFALENPDAVKAGDKVVLTLEQQSRYDQHALGKFRVSQSAIKPIESWAMPTFSDWQYAGPIALSGKRFELIDNKLGPENGFDASATYGEQNVGWIAKPEWKDGALADLVDERKSAHYLYRTINLALPTTLTLSFGSTDAIQVWLNGEEKLKKNEQREAAANQDEITLTLGEGEYELLVKVVNFKDAADFYFDARTDGGEEFYSLMRQIQQKTFERSEETQRALRYAFRARDAEWRERQMLIDQKRDELDAVESSIVSTMVMTEMETPRETYLLTRGLYTAPDTSEQLYPEVPSRLGALTDEYPPNRLGLAQWLVNPDHPLTARVRVNHYWQMYFDRGIVETSEDFGVQGSPPSHPDLLNWLAIRFIETDWDVKAMQKNIVMSATYRQQSHVTKEMLTRDPKNVWLARAPRTRLPAEMIRDQALAVSGLLNAEIGGPSVRPYQPPNMWSSLSFQNMDEYDTNFYVQDTGDKIYRRGLYTFWKRTILPPRMQIFDAAGREMCEMRTETTNTPMQALALMNDPTFVEAARHLGSRMLREGGSSDADRIRYGYKTALAYEPDESRFAILADALHEYRAYFLANPADAEALLEVGDSPADSTFSSSESAAYAMLGSTILNLDEMITRE